jgi:hypothetical protein
MPIGSEQVRVMGPGGKAPGLDAADAFSLGGAAGVDFPVHAAGQHRVTTTAAPMTVRMMRSRRHRYWAHDPMDLA